jgi:MFS family permease
MWASNLRAKPGQRDAPLAPVWALGVTQIIGYGTLYYAFALMVPAISAEFEVGAAQFFGIFSLGFLLAGFAAPRIGRLMDAQGAPRLMAIGSLSAAILLAILVVSPNFTVFAVLILLIEWVGLLVLYDAAFVTLARISGAEARRQITRLTLIAGFASTLFWPLTGWLVDVIGWRGTYGVFAALHLFCAFPLHLWLARAFPPVAPAAASSGAPLPAFKALPPEIAGKAFLALALSFALSGFVISAMSVHMVGILTGAGLGVAATAASMLMGPAQVASRIIEAGFGNRLHPLWAALVSALALPLSLALLFLPFLGGVSPWMSPWVAGCLFAIVSGMGQGLASIVRGTVPLALFGSSGFGSRLGRISAVRTTLSAGAPFVFALSVERFGMAETQLFLIAIGVTGALPLPFLLAAARRNA